MITYLFVGALGNRKPPASLFVAALGNRKPPARGWLYRRLPMVEPAPCGWLPETLAMASGKSLQKCAAHAPTNN